MEVIFLLVLIIRSSLDIFTNISFHVGPSKLNIPSAVGILILIMGMYFILRRRIVLNRASIVFGIWLLTLVPFVFISIINIGIEGVTGLREWVRLLTILMVFILSYSLLKKNSIHQLINLMLLSLVVPLSVGAYQLMTNSSPVIGRIHRVDGTFDHPNALAFYLVLCIGLTCWKLVTSKNKLWLLPLVLETAGLIATFSLNAFILFYVLNFFLFFGARGKQKIAIICFVSLFTLTVLLTPQYQQRYTRLKKINVRKTIETKKPVESVTWRVLNWGDLLSVWKEKPILGHGLNSASFVNPRKRWNSSGEGFSPHNDYLKSLVETGVVGFIVYLGFLVSMGYQIYVAYKRAEDKELKSLLFILLVVFFLWLIGSSAGNWLNGTAFQYCFWAICGFTLSRSNVPNSIAGDIECCKERQ